MSTITPKRIQPHAHPEPGRRVPQPPVLKADDFTCWGITEPIARLSIETIFGLRGYFWGGNYVFDDPKVINIHDLRTEKIHPD